MRITNEKGEQIKYKTPSLLDEVLERRMLLYVLAAGATLAGASSAQAKVVFTPSNAVLFPGSNHHPNTLSIDLNNDGMADFVLVDYGSNFISTAEYRLEAGGYGRNGVLEQGSQLAALPAGAKIGPSATFEQKGQMCYAWNNPGSSGSRGPFAHTELRFLGVRFLIGGKVHYAWIGFRSVGGNGPFNHVIADLLGWAYETEPNKPILAGSGQGSVFPYSAAIRSAEPTSLELLAAGYVTVADWRRRGAAIQPLAPAL
jgi:hypothetical protein